MEYYILILVNDKSPFLTKNEIFKALYSRNFKHLGKMWSGRFEMKIVNVVVERVQTEKDAIQLATNGLFLSGRFYKWDMILPCVDLIQPQEDIPGEETLNLLQFPNATTEAFRQIMVWLRAANKENLFDIGLPRVKFLIDKPSIADLLTDETFYQYIHSIICCGDIEDLKGTLIDEFKDLIITRTPCNLYDLEKLAAIPPIINNEMPVIERAK